MFRFVFERGVQCPDLFYFHLLEKGIHLWEGRACFLSTAHTDADVAEVIRIVQESVAAMRDGGFFPATRRRRATALRHAARTLRTRRRRVHSPSHGRAKRHLDAVATR